MSAEPVPAPSMGEERAPRSALGDISRRFARDPAALTALVILATVVLAALTAPWIAAHVLHRTPDHLRLMDRVTIGGRQVDVVSDVGIPIGPGRAAPLGVDLIGRDILTRLLYGARVSLFTSILGTLLALLVGLAAGLLAGYYGGIVDSVLSRFVDAMMAIPVLLLAIALASVLRQGSVLMVVLVLVLVNWTYLARIVRAEVLSLKQREFIEAARALGARDAGILTRHLLPNLLGPLIVFATLSVAGNILLESALSFLGVGIQPPTPSWGNMIAAGRDALVTAPWVALAPAAMVALVVLACSLLADGLERSRAGRSA
jgi:peptide/nickel transport system permease protein